MTARKTSALDRLRESLRQSLAIFEAVDPRRPGIGWTPEDWPNYVEIARESADLCRKILAQDLCAEEIERQERENKRQAARSEAKARADFAKVMARIEAQVDSRLTKRRRAR